MPWSPEAPSPHGEPFPGLIYWTQPRTLLTSLLPPCGSFADATGLCPSPLLFSLYGLSQASISHLQVLVTTCRPTAPKSLSLVQPPFWTIIYLKDWGSRLRLSSAETPGFSPQPPRETPAPPDSLLFLSLTSIPAQHLSPAQALSSLPWIPQQPPTWSPSHSSTPPFTSRQGQLSKPQT